MLFSDFIFIFSLFSPVFALYFAVGYRFTCRIGIRSWVWGVYIVNVHVTFEILEQYSCSTNISFGWLSINFSIFVWCMAILNENSRPKNALDSMVVSFINAQGHTLIPNHLWELHFPVGFFLTTFSFNAWFYSYCFLSNVEKVTKMNQIIVVKIEHMHLFVISQKGTSLVVLLNEIGEPYSPSGDEEREITAHVALKAQNVETESTTIAPTILP